MENVKLAYNALFQKHTQQTNYNVGFLLGQIIHSNDAMDRGFQLMSKSPAQNI